MGDLVDLDAFRKKKEQEEEEKRKAEEEAQQNEDINYLKEVLSIMLQSLPPITGSAFYVSSDDEGVENYYFDSSWMGFPYDNPEEDIAPSDDEFIAYDWGWPDEEEDPSDF